MPTSLIFFLAQRNLAQDRLRALVSVVSVALGTAVVVAADFVGAAIHRAGEELSEAQRYQVNDLLVKLARLRERTLALLALLAELKQGTIDRILEMDDEELGRRALRGELGDWPGPA
jgi:hypothetical protein